MITIKHVDGCGSTYTPCKCVMDAFIEMGTRLNQYEILIKKIVGLCHLDSPEKKILKEIALAHSDPNAPEEK